MIGIIHKSQHSRQRLITGLISAISSQKKQLVSCHMKSILKQWNYWIAQLVLLKALLLGLRHFLLALTTNQLLEFASANIKKPHELLENQFELVDNQQLSLYNIIGKFNDYRKYIRREKLLKINEQSRI